MSFFFNFSCFLLHSILVSSAEEQWRKGCDLGASFSRASYSNVQIKWKLKQKYLDSVKTLNPNFDVFFPSKLGEDQKHQSRHVVRSQLS